MVQNAAGPPAVVYPTNASGQRASGPPAIVPPTPAGDNPQDPNYALYQAAKMWGTSTLSKAQIQAVQNYLNVYHKAGLTVDGVAGPKTNTALGFSAAGPPSTPNGATPKANNAGNTTTTGSTGGNGANNAAAPTPAASSNQQIDDYIRQNYGYMAWALDVPDLRDALETAARQGFDKDKLQAAINNTNWSKTHNDAQVAYQQLLGSNPAQAKAQLQQKLNDAQSYGAQMGVPLSDDRARAIANDAVTLGWNDAELHAAVANEFHYDPKNPTGINSTTQALIAAANSYVLPYSDASINQWTRDIVAGKTTVDVFKAQLAQQAKNQYNDPNLQAAIDGGQTVRQYLEPTVNKAADMLGINNNTIDVTQGKWNKLFLQTRDQNGVMQVPTQDQVEKQIKSDNAFGWSQSKNGQEEYAQLTQKLEQQMGIRK